MNNSLASTFTRIYVFEYKFNEMENVNIVFLKFNVWCHRKLGGSDLGSILLVIVWTEI